MQRHLVFQVRVIMQNPAWSRLGHLRFFVYRFLRLLLAIIAQTFTKQIVPGLLFPFRTFVTRQRPFRDRFCVEQVGGNQSKPMTGWSCGRQQSGRNAPIWRTDTTTVQHAFVLLFPSSRNAVAVGGGPSSKNETLLLFVFLRNLCLLVEDERR